MKIIGHRGARGLAPENTLASIEHGLKHHVDEVEIDVRVTHDYVPILHHDQHLRVAGERLHIAKHNFEDLRARKPDLITLEAALANIGTRARTYVEVKPGEPIGPIVTVLKQYRPERLLVGSKSQKTLRALHKALPRVEKIVIEPWSGVLASWRARQVDATRISMRSWWLWSGFLRGMHRSGYQITPYTVNNPAKVRKWQDHIYGIVTDRPDLFDS